MCTGRKPRRGVSSKADGRARSLRAPHHLRHLDCRRDPERGGLRQGVAGGARHRCRHRHEQWPPVLAATVGASKGPTVVLHGHLDVVPAEAQQSTPHLDGDRLYGRGAYDMKGGLAAMMCASRDLAAQEKVKVHFVCCCDEESEEDQSRGSDYIAREMGYLGDFAITGEPTDMLIGVQAKGVLLLRIDVRGRSAHGSTPWLGDNAVLKALDVFRAIQSLPFARESSEMFDRASINLGRVSGGDVPNKVPDHCVIDV